MLLRLLMVALLLWLAQGRELVPGVLTWPAGRCDVMLFQVHPAVVVACPGQDLRKVWPWPPEAPWFEDNASHEAPPGLREAHHVVSRWPAPRRAVSV